MLADIQKALAVSVRIRFLLIKVTLKAIVLGVGAGAFKIGSPSRHEQERNIVMQNNEDMNVKYYFGDANKGDIEGGVIEGNDKELLRNRSIKIVTRDPEIKEDPLYKGTFQ